MHLFYDPKKINLNKKSLFDNKNFNKADFLCRIFDALQNKIKKKTLMIFT